MSMNHSVRSASDAPRDPSLKLRRSINKPNYWTTQEDSILLQYMNLYPNCGWKVIADMVGTDKTPDQCCQRWHRVLNPEIRHVDWTHEEDCILTTWVSHYKPGSWRKIAKHIRGRTGQQCRYRWRQLKKVTNPQSTSTPSTHSTSSSENEGYEPGQYERSTSMVSSCRVSKPFRHAHQSVLPHPKQLKVEPSTSFGYGVDEEANGFTNTTVVPVESPTDLFATKKHEFANQPKKPQEAPPISSILSMFLDAAALLQPRHSDSEDTSNQAADKSSQSYSTTQESAPMPSLTSPQKMSISWLID
eukprot:TRINITY_DN5866_c0_g1_i1.p1 TRINITY_DN5866_c0_g1~~TRINITY_DN5866_c0_g1_i1.p1  ORF type:complete len:302 (+),score=50.13 TRINITY_DN5866_c0_g1_i1:76-981(+)